MDSDRLSLGIRDCVFLLFHLQGTRDGFACRSVPSVWIVEWKPVISMRRVCEGNMYVNAGYFHDSCQWDVFQTVSLLPLPWLGFTTLVQRGSPHYQTCFLLSLLSELPQWHGVLELSEAHGNLLLKELLLKHRETLCICILLIELYLYNWHNCVFLSRIGSLITS